VCEVWGLTECRRGCCLQMNVLNEGVMAAFEPILSQLETDASVKGAVLLSGKDDSWVAGADIKMLDACKTADELADLSRAGQKMMDRLAALRKPVVAAINGFCLGGGAELAMACHYRIASTSPKTKLGLPEVQLGLLPGSGGTQRLPKLVGIQTAITMMTTGQQVDAERARKSGLVDAVADPFALREAALQAARAIAAGTLKHKPKAKPLIPTRLLENNPIGRNVLFSQAGKMIEAKAGKAYPAPMEILRSVQAGVDQGHSRGQEYEATAFGKLGMTSVSAALRSIYFASTAAKKNPFPVPADKRISTVAVLGAGLMGAGIAEVSATKAGLNVLLRDKMLAGLARGEKQIADNLKAKVKKRRLSEFDAGRTQSRVAGFADEPGHPTPGWERQLPRADAVIEAVFEEIGIKHKVIKELESTGLRDDAVLASNTSAIPIADLATASRVPERVIGMHYFSPVDKMPLLEVIPHAGTSQEVIGKAFDLGLKQGKTVIVVKDVPGFYVNRCLGPFMAEAFALMQDGVSVERLDKAMKSFGFPVGPVTLADEVGIDVAQHVNSFLSAHLGERMGGSDATVLKDMIAAGMLGRKAGKGFFTYGGKGGKSKTVNQDALGLMKKYIRAGAKGDAIDDATIQNRMSGRFLIEALLCLQDDIIRSPTDGDIGAVFGIGFPPFRGGPFRHIDAIGASTLRDQLRGFADKHGPQFNPPAILEEYASGNKLFHPRA
jgi:enoyl-CoA hydratase / long-chain 3-hydroxyacyl-CoA dehydrogenase